MRTLFVLLLIPCFGLTQQPQFKFWLAFEDAKFDRDTVWFCIDESAQSVGFDSLFGDTNAKYANLDSTNMHIHFSKTDSTERNLLVDGINVSGNWSHQIFGDNAVSPIIIRWDTNLMLNHILPFDINAVYLESDYFFFNGFTFGYDLIHNREYPEADSVMLEYFEMGGGPASHFPLRLIVSDEVRDYWSVGESIAKSIKVFPNPTSDGVISFQGITNLNLVEIFDAQGSFVKQVYPHSNAVSIKELKAGMYFFKIHLNDTSTYTKVYKQ